MRNKASVEVRTQAVGSELGSIDHQLLRRVGPLSIPTFWTNGRESRRAWSTYQKIFPFLPDSFLLNRTSTTFPASTTSLPAASPIVTASR